MSYHDFGSMVVELGPFGPGISWAPNMRQHGVLYLRVGGTCTGEPK